jgi:predicted MPP superfamily phosphohydrolase
MKALNFVIFLSVAFTVYGLINWYIFLHGWHALPPHSQSRTAYLTIFLFLSLSFIAGRFLERAWLSPVSEALVWIGSFWLGAMVYFLLGMLLLDLVRLLNFFFPLYPPLITRNYAQTKLILGVAMVCLVTLVVAAGYVNAISPQIKTLSISLSKKGGEPRQCHIVAASDIHLGTIIGRRHLAKIVGKINNLNADVVLLPGDIVDEDLGPVVKENLGETLRNISSRFGVFAVTGNHEYIGGVEEACAYLGEHGITMLRDSVVRLENGVQIVGREDRSIGQFRGRKRAPLEALVAQLDTTLPVILMDHQPFRLEEAMSNGVDLQLSGHTHHGQLWPFNFITKAVYEISCGYRRVGKTHFYVSSGVGTWGPPLRLGNRPEIVSIILTYD